jgi:DNA-binding transcriptional ArsR family regulator
MLLTYRREMDDASRIERTTLAEVGSVLGHKVRAGIMMELHAGTPLSAGTLAVRLGVSPSGISNHVARLSDVGLVAMERSGRTRLYSLSSSAVAEALEVISNLSPPQSVLPSSLRFARSCYDHLAGQLGVALCKHFVDRGWLDATDDEPHTLTDAGRRTFTAAGLNFSKPSPRRLVRSCTDWSEARPHVAGGLGASLLTASLVNGWLRRDERNRTLTLTELGQRSFDNHFGFRAPSAGSENR